MQCFDDLSKLEFHGIYKSENARTLRVALSRCYGKPYCKSDEEIREFIDEHSVHILYNDQRYNPDIFDADRTIEKTLNHESFPLFYET